MAIMPELITKSSIIGRSATGKAVLSFDDETSLQRWLKMNEGRDFRVKFFKQTITEQEVPIQLETISATDDK